MSGLLRGVQHTTFLEESLDGRGEGFEVNGLLDELGAGPGLVELEEQGGGCAVANRATANGRPSHS